MRLILLLFLFSIQFTDALNCIDGFTSINNKCLRLISSDNSRENARRRCNLYGGNLVSIHNSIDNNAVAQFAFSNSDPIWIGLKCSADRTPSSCIWDDQFGNASSYSNFIAGNPGVDIGQCVYMLTTGSIRGEWLSGECDTTPLSAVCETDPIGQCSHSYEGYCYYPLGELTANEAQNACAQHCNGSLVSIHDESTNSYILSLFQDPSKAYFQIGARLSSSNINSWNDGTSWDYSNIGYQSYTAGECYSMSRVNEIVAPGKWISSNCSSYLPSVCEWLPGSSCVSPTSVPSQCTEPLYFTGNATIYSPNYPYAYTETDTYPCYYILTAPSGQAVLWFNVLDLDPDASFEFYPDLESETPFLTINQSTQGIIDKTITNSSSIIKMVFKPCTQNCDKNIKYTWIAKFKSFGIPYSSGCNQGTSPINSFISSPNYPNNYSTNLNCTYQIYNRFDRGIQLHFDFFNTVANQDYVRVYDGYTTPILLATLSGDLPSNNLTIVSTTYYMFVIFTTTESSNTAGGFIARLIDNP